MATHGLHEIKILWNKRYNALIPVHGVTNRILWRDSNYVVGMVMWQKFGNSSIFTTEVIITSIL